MMKGKRWMIMNKLFTPRDMVVAVWDSRVSEGEVMGCPQCDRLNAVCNDNSRTLDTQNLSVNPV
jgi:hypothetical protein